MFFFVVVFLLLLFFFVPDYHTNRRVLMGLTHRRKKIAEKIEKFQPLAVNRVKKELTVKEIVA